MRDKKPFIIQIVIGILCVGVGLFVKLEYYSTLIFAMGGGIAFSSMVQLIRIAYWQSPKRHTAYEAKMQEAHIDKVDERKQYLRMKAGSIAYQMIAFALLILAFLLAVFRASAWVVGMVFLLFVFQWIVGIAIYRVLEKII